MHSHAQRFAQRDVIAAEVVRLGIEGDRPASAGVPAMVALELSEPRQPRSRPKTSRLDLTQRRALVRKAEAEAA